MEVRTLGHRFGAEIVGVDIGRGVDASTFDRIRTTFDRHRLIVFRGQRIEGDAQVRFSERFGELEGHVRQSFRDERHPCLHIVSNLDASGNPTHAVRSLGNYHWHTDKSYMPRPSWATLLHAIELPPEGGDTCFADMCAAFRALPPRQQAFLETRFAVHSWETSRIRSGSPPATEQEKRDAPPVRHPMVRIHPGTGERALYIGNHASHIEGMDREESEAHLTDLLAHATQPEFVYRHRWRAGDLVMWDNRSLLHRALDDFDLAAHRRVLHRTVIRGEATH